MGNKPRGVAYLILAWQQDKTIGDRPLLNPGMAQFGKKSHNLPIWCHGDGEDLLSMIAMVSSGEKMNNIFRQSWGKDFPETDIYAKEGAVKSHESYQLANKKGV